MFFESQNDRFAYLNSAISSDNLLINYEILQINRQILNINKQVLYINQKLLETNNKRNQELIEILKEIRDNGIKRNI